MEYLESSIFLRYLGQGYLVIEEKINSVYLSSFTHRLIRKTIETMKIGFKYSIFGRLTEINEDAARDFFQTSKATRIALNGMRNLKDKLIAISATSSSIISIRSLKCDFFLKPLKVGGIIVITAIVANLILSIILHRHISLWGWPIRVVLIFLGIVGIFSELDWSTLKTNSIFFKKKDVSR